MNRIEKQGATYVVYAKRDIGDVPILFTPDKSQAELMYKYITKV